VKVAAAVGLLLAVGGSTAWLLLLPPAVPAESDFELDLPELRRLAAEPGGSLPSEIHVLAVAAVEKPLVGALGGLRLDSFAMPWTAFQIVYRDSFLLVDAPGARATERDAGDAEAGPRASLDRALERASSVLFTHEHPDHVGGVARSPGLPELAPRLLLTPEQIAAAEERDLPEALRAGLRPLRYERRLRVAPGVVLVAAPGHTPGSQIVYVRLEGGREVLLVGDIAWHRRHFEEPRGHPRVSAWVLGEDLPRVLAQLRSLHEAWRSEGVVIVPSHDGLYLAELVESGLLRRGFE
jgi:glyoxylase-like metal-dependent hydrolase (beta-lactamase superfamily II)